MHVVPVSTPEDLLRKVDIVIVAIPGSADLNMINGLNSELFKDRLIIDLCTAKPSDKRKISEIIDDAGGSYVDVAALGSFPALKHQVPLLISGGGSDKMIEAFENLGLNIKKMSESAGDAMIVKLCRSIYMKGLAALTVEMTEVSEAYGVKEQVWASLAESMDNDQFLTYSPRLITGTIRNLERRTLEVEECLDLITNMGKCSIMTEATLKKYKYLKSK